MIPQDSLLPKSDSAWQRQVAQPLQYFLGQTRNRKRPRSIGGGKVELKFGKAVSDINRGDTNGQMDEFNLDTQTSLGEAAITDIHYQWLSQEKVSAGKEIAIMKVDGTWYLLWAECEDPDPVQVGP